MHDLRAVARACALKWLFDTVGNDGILQGGHVLNTEYMLLTEDFDNNLVGEVTFIDRDPLGDYTTRWSTTNPPNYVTNPDSDQLVNQGIVEPGYTIMEEVRELPDDTKQHLRYLVKKAPERGFANLKDAVGTNQIASYFPFISVQGEKDPSHYVLTRLQQAAAGRIKLGLDLQGGTSFVVQMDTNAIERAEEKQAVLSQAVEVLRKRVDNLGVAEPIHQPAGEDRIMIQLPGLA